MCSSRLPLWHTYFQKHFYWCAQIRVWCSWRTSDTWLIRKLFNWQSTHGVLHQTSANSNVSIGQVKGISKTRQKNAIKHKFTWLTDPDAQQVLLRQNIYTVAASQRESQQCKRNRITVADFLLRLQWKTNNSLKNHILLYMLPQQLSFNTKLTKLKTKKFKKSYRS